MRGVLSDGEVQCEFDTSDVKYPHAAMVLYCDIIAFSGCRKAMSSRGITGTCYMQESPFPARVCLNDVRSTHGFKLA